MYLLFLFIYFIFVCAQIVCRWKNVSYYKLKLFLRNSWHYRLHCFCPKAVILIAILQSYFTCIMWNRRITIRMNERCYGILNAHSFVNRLVIYIFVLFRYEKVTTIIYRIIHTVNFVEHFNYSLLVCEAKCEKKNMLWMKSMCLHWWSGITLN